MGMGQGIRTGLGQGGIICVLQTQFSSSQFIHHHILFNISANQSFIKEVFLFHCHIACILLMPTSLNSYVM